MYKVKMPDSIKTDIMAALETDIDKREGSFSQDMSAPLAEELNKMYQALEKIKPMVWVDETSGIYLDMAAEDLGMEPRKTGTKAQVTLQIDGNPGYIIPSGTTFMSDDDMLFDTDADTVIPGDGIATAVVIAQKIGAKYNADENTIRFFYANDSRLNKVTNLEPAIGGTDPETDKSLYARLVLARQRPATSGNAYHYEMWALEVSGVGAVRVFPLWNGNGTVKVLIADDDRQPVDDAVVRACFDHIEEERPTTARVTVVSATIRPIHVDVSIKLRPGTNEVKVEENLKEYLAEYLRSISLKEYEVRHSKLGAILLEVPGIIDYTDLMLNGQPSTVLLTKEEIPVLGEVLPTWIS